MKKSVHLGFEVGTGEPVEIPLRHLAVAGMTQEAGKTTTLEALISRSGLRAITFITKRGEGSFTGARRVQPYFRDQSDWQYVAAILEASRGEKLKLERAFIIRASKGARTLADVQRNVRALLADPKLRGMAADMYLCLDAYLEVVVPQIASVKWAPSVELAPGVNVMDLGGLALEMQHLVIRSTITWVLEHAERTVVVVPEAWKFIPQGRGTPVKLAAEAYIRQGAALGNYLWLDSQDLGGIEKAILRSVSVWLLGVQREANEIKRTLDNIPASASKPSPGAIAQLRLGEFFACWSDRTVRTYVQPAWMDRGEAHSVAMGSIPTPAAPKARKREGRAMDLEGFVGRGRAAQDAVDREITRHKEDPKMCEQHQKLEKEVAQLTRSLAAVSEEVARKTKEAAAAQDQARAAADLGRALGRLFPAGAGGGAAVVDEEAIVARVLARIPAGGAGPITVTPPEKLRKDFQRDETARIVTAASLLKALAKKVLALLESTEGAYVSQKGIAERLGRSTGGGSWIDLTTQIKELAGAGFVEIDQKRGVHATVRSKIAGDLAFYQASEGEIEAVYQNVLHAIATGDE